MKVVKSKISIAVLGLGFASLIGAVSYATLSRPAHFPSNAQPNLPKKEPVVAATPKIVAPHQDEIEKYLDQMGTYMQTPPRDGVFGSDRIPTLHGRESDDITAYESIRDLEGKNYLRSVVLGLEPKDDVTAKSTPVVTAPGTKIQNSETDKIRLSDVHYVTPDSSEEGNAIKEWNSETEALRKFAVSIRKKGLEQDVETLNLNGKQHWIVAKAIHASVNSCYKCHDNVKKGEPIGYVAALISDAKN